MSYLDDLERLSISLGRIPATLIGLRTELVGLKRQATDASEAVKNHEAEELSLVTAAVYPESLKPLFSNAATREAEVRQRLAKDTTYLDLVAAERQAQHAKSMAEIAITHAEDEERVLNRQFDAIGLAFRADFVRGLEVAIREFTLMEARRLSREESTSAGS